MKKDLRINVRIGDALKKRIRKAKGITGIPETLVVISCLEAYCSYVEQHKEFTLPLALVPKSELPDDIAAGCSDELPARPLQKLTHEAVAAAIEQFPEAETQESDDPRSTVRALAEGFGKTTKKASPAPAQRQ